jgi:hypothetical protein
MKRGMNQARAQRRSIKAAAEIKAPDRIAIVRGELPVPMASSLQGADLAGGAAENGYGPRFSVNKKTAGPKACRDFA